MDLEKLKEDLMGDGQSGTIWPKQGITMIGLQRLNHLHGCLQTVVYENIVGDVIECGVWRGGACIFMKAYLDSIQDTRKVYVADSFNGFPISKSNWDKHLDFLDDPVLKVPRKEVEQNFVKYNVLDNRVVFVEGWFEDTLPSIDGPLAILRADGDLFESTTDILENLYDKVSPGGYVIIDDYHIDSCRAAVHQYRERFGITDQMYGIDFMGVFWRKS